MRSGTFKILDIVLHCVPLKNYVVMFSSFSDQYSDNPKAISEKIHELYPSINVVWVISERTKIFDIPEYVEKVKMNSFRHAIRKNSAKVIIDNYTGIYSKFTSPSDAWKYKLLKRKGQINYSTWHGTPLKKIGRAIMDRGDDAFVTTTDGFILNSDYIKKIFQRDFSNSIPVYQLGSARNDLLFIKDGELRKKIKKRLDLADDRHYVLYAPTFRNTDKLDGESYSIELQIDQVKKILSSFSRKFGGEWSLINRVHQKIKSAKVTDSNEHYIVNGNLHDDMAEYLFACDALITDFSGSLFDIANTSKPCFLYAPDYEHYRDEERGLYLSIDILPYTFSTTIEQLLSNIQSFDLESQKMKVEEFNRYLGNIDDGNASKRIAELIFRTLNGDPKQKG